MRAAKLLAVLAIAALGIGLFSAVALAGKKRDTKVTFFTGSPGFSCGGPCNVGETGGTVSAKGTLHTVTACKSQRVVKLQVVDANGDVIAAAPIDEPFGEDVTNTGGNWSVERHLPRDLPPGTNSVRVRAKKRTAGKFVCKAGVSISVPIPIPIPGQKLGS